MVGLKLNLGCGTDIKPGFVNVDRCEYPGVDAIMDFDDYPAWDFDDDSVSYIYAHHILEHLEDLTYVMEEIHRICMNGAIVDIVVPLAHSLWDVANPTHRIRFNHRTFQCYCKGFEFSDLSFKPLFELAEQHIEREPDEWFEGICWTVANLHVVLKVIK